jgi:glycosyltransferase involved in cell wall biosynthesis
VEDGVTGFLTDEDTAAFAVKMSRLVTEPDLRRKMGAAAREASSNYAIERALKLMIGHYEQLVRDAAPRKRGLRFRIRTLIEQFQQ